MEVPWTRRSRSADELPELPPLFMAAERVQGPQELRAAGTLGTPEEWRAQFLTQAEQGLSVSELREAHGLPREVPMSCAVHVGAEVCFQVEVNVLPPLVHQTAVQLGAYGPYDERSPCPVCRALGEVRKREARALRLLEQEREKTQRLEEKVQQLRGELELLR